MEPGADLLHRHFQRYEVGFVARSVVAPPVVAAAALALTVAVRAEEVARAVLVAQAVAVVRAEVVAHVGVVAALVRAADLQLAAPGLHAAVAQAGYAEAEAAAVELGPVAGGHYREQPAQWWALRSS